MLPRTARSLGATNQGLLEWATRFADTSPGLFVVLWLGLVGLCVVLFLVVRWAVLHLWEPQDGESGGGRKTENLQVGGGNAEVAGLVGAVSEATQPQADRFPGVQPQGRDREGAERLARIAAQEAEREKNRELQAEELAFAKALAGNALGAGAAVFIGILLVALVLCVFAGVGRHGHFLEALRTVGLGGLAVGFVAGLGTILRKLPWYALSRRRLIESGRERRRRAEEQAEARKKAEEQRHRREAEEAVRRREQEEAHRRAAKERAQVLSDGGRRECWWNLGWWDFEIAVLLGFENNGFAVEATEPSRDGGLDGFVKNEEEEAGIQCKHFGSNEFVGVADIRDLIGALHMRGLTRGYFVTTGQYSDPARALADESQGTGIRIALLGIEDLTESCNGLRITQEVIAAAKRRWNVPQDPPPDMPQGPQRRRIYRRGWGGRRRHRRWY